MKLTPEHKKLAELIAQEHKFFSECPYFQGGPAGKPGKMGQK